MFQTFVRLPLARNPFVARWPVDSRSAGFSDVAYVPRTRLRSFNLLPHLRQSSPNAEKPLALSRALKQALLSAPPVWLIRQDVSHIPNESCQKRGVQFKLLTSAPVSLALSRPGHMDMSYHDDRSGSGSLTLNGSQTQAVRKHTVYARFYTQRLADANPFLATSISLSPTAFYPRVMTASNLNRFCHG